jgi:predicted transcriptional regulator
MIVSTSTGLKQLREELSPKVSQERLARQADITLATYRSAEAGNKCKYSTAKKILDALNSERQARQKPPVTIDDLGLSLE